MGSLKDGAKQHGQLVGQSVRRILLGIFSKHSCAGLAMAQLSVNKRDFEPLVLGGGALHMCWDKRLKHWLWATFKWVEVQAAPGFAWNTQQNKQCWRCASDMRFFLENSPTGPLLDRGI